MDEKEKYVEIILEEFEKLPPEFQPAFLWVAVNIKVIMELCKGPKMSEKKIEVFSRIALEKEDYITYALIQFKKAIDSQEEN